MQEINILGEDLEDYEKVYGRVDTHERIGMVKMDSAEI